MSKPLIVIADMDTAYLAELENKFLVELGDRAELEIISDPEYFEQFFSNPVTAEIVAVGQGEEGFYSFKFTHNYEELQLEISKEILNGKTTTHTALVMSLIYDSEIYQVLNGKTDWAIHIVGKDLETGGELMNINFPEEGYHISIENWDNM
ncbi:MAG: hypothetical protein ACLSHE_03790 [Roseburia sp.]